MFFIKKYYAEILVQGLIQAFYGWNLHFHDVAWSQYSRNLYYLTSYRVSSYSGDRQILVRWRSFISESELILFPSNIFPESENGA